MAQASLAKVRHCPTLMGKGFTMTCQPPNQGSRLPKTGRAAQVSPSVDLLTVLRAIDPSWSGRWPVLGNPIVLSTPDGRNPVDALLQEERER